MQVNGHPQRLRPLKDHPELLLVQVLSVGVPIHQRPFEAQLRHCAFQFTRRLFGVLHGQRGEAGQSRWMAPNQVC